MEDQLIGTLHKDTELLSFNLRKHIIDMTHRGESSHVGSCLSIADYIKENLL